MLAIVTSHPIQYQAPLWRALARDGRVPFEVWFLTPHALKPALDPEFGRTFSWDLDLLEGYPHRFLEIESGWSLDRFDGIRLKNPWGHELRARGASALWIEGWRFRTLWHAAFAAHRAGIPVWLRGESHSLGPRRTGPRAWAKTLLLRQLFRRIDRFLCIGSANRRFYLDHGVAEHRLAPAPYCVDNLRFAGASVELRLRRNEFRRRWNLDEHAWTVLFCGKLIPKKRPLDLLDAIHRAAGNAGRKWQVLFAGDGELAGTIRTALAATGGPRGAVTGFLNQTEIPEAFAAADCLVLPSDHRETWGLVVNEALASGVPPIVSDQCGCAADLALPLGSAHVFPCGDASALTRCLAAVEASPPPPDALARLAAAHAPERTVETVAALASGHL